MNKIENQPECLGDDYTTTLPTVRAGKDAHTITPITASIQPPCYESDVEEVSPYSAASASASRTMAFWTEDVPATPTSTDSPSADAGMDAATAYLAALYGEDFIADMQRHNCTPIEEASDEEFEGDDQSDAAIRSRAERAKAKASERSLAAMLDPADDRYSAEYCSSFESTPFVRSAAPTPALVSITGLVAGSGGGGGGGGGSGGTSSAPADATTTLTTADLWRVNRKLASWTWHADRDDQTTTAARLSV